MRLIICGLLIFTVAVRGANILSIIPFPSLSHQRPLLAVCKELALRGNNVTVITTNPPKEVIPNFNVIDVSSTYLNFKALETKNGFSFQKEFGPFEFVSYFADIVDAICDYQLSLPVVQELIRNAENTKFDVVIVENLLFSSYFGLVHKLGHPPVVAIYTFIRWGPTDWAMGIPAGPSYIPELVIGSTDEMTFSERVMNTLLYWWMLYQTEFGVFPTNERILRKYFGDNMPSAREMEYNKSLVLRVSDLAVDYSVPEPPNVIEVGPLHITPPKPLPKDLQSWIDGAQEGVIYLSFGSNKKSSDLPEKKRQAFVKAFAQFPKVRVLWKWESDEKIPGITDNVLTQKWFPQQDLLASPKLLAVIFQGGVQSMQEIIHNGVPTVGIPFYGDQRRNVRKLLKEGAGITINTEDISYETVYDALNKLLYDKSYKENALRLSSISRDQIVPGMDKAIWWIEYVIRHKGAKHLRPGSLKLHWFQVQLLDVYLFLLLIPLVTILVAYKILRIIASHLSTNKNINKQNSKKIN